jgi:hypothetical protein
MRRRISRKAHLGLTTRFLLLSDSYGFVDVGSSLWREEGSAVYNCWWPSPAQAYMGPSPAGRVTIFYYLRFQTPPTWRARSLYLYPSGTESLSYTLGSGFRFRRLLRLAGLKWRYSKTPPHGVDSSCLRSSLYTFGADPQKTQDS